MVQTPTHAHLQCRRGLNMQWSSAFSFFRWINTVVVKHFRDSHTSCFKNCACTFTHMCTQDVCPSCCDLFLCDYYIWCWCGWWSFLMAIFRKTRKPQTVFTKYFTSSKQNKQTNKNLFLCSTTVYICAFCMHCVESLTYLKGRDIWDQKYITSIGGWMDRQIDIGCSVSVLISGEKKMIPKNFRLTWFHFCSLAEYFATSKYCPHMNTRLVNLTFFM